MPEVAHVLEELYGAPRPQDEPEDHGQQLSKANGGRPVDQLEVDEDIGKVEEHEEPEEAKPKPGATKPDGEGERGQGDHVHHRLQGEQGREQAGGRQHPQEEEQEKHNAEGKIYLQGDVLVPGDALLHEGPRGVDDEEDHSGDVAGEFEDDEHPSCERLTRDE